MGEARRRGTYEERVAQAIERDKKLSVQRAIDMAAAGGVKESKVKNGLGYFPFRSGNSETIDAITLMALMAGMKGGKRK